MSWWMWALAWIAIDAAILRMFHVLVSRDE